MKESIAGLLQDRPRLKGSEIAKHLAMNKKEVNSFLSKNKDAFIQDNDFRWSNINLKEIIVEFEKNWIDCDSFENSLKNAGEILESDSPSIVFCLPSKCKMMLVVTARFLSLCNQLALKGKGVTIDFSACIDSFTYLDRMGFLEHLHEDIIIKPERPTESRADKYKGKSNALVEFDIIVPQELNNDIVTKLTNIFVEHSSENYYIPIFTIFGEMVGNISEHSNTTINGFAGLQRYKGNQEHIQTVISDSGDGIAKTLRPSLKKYYPDLYRTYKEESVESDIGLITEVLTKGLISRKGDGCGLGYNRSKDYAMEFNARVSIRQETYSLEFIYKDGALEERKEKKDLTKISGTHICFDFIC
jgi:hypothetical protein